MMLKSKEIKDVLSPEDEVLDLEVKFFEQTKWSRDEEKDRHQSLTN